VDATLGAGGHAADLLAALPQATLLGVDRDPEALALARGDGRHPRLLRNLGRADLLILDDWGLEPLDAAARHDLLEILEERYGRHSTMITSQLPVDRWHEIIGVQPMPTPSGSFVHNAHRIELAAYAAPGNKTTETTKRHAGDTTIGQRARYRAASFVAVGDIIQESGRHYPLRAACRMHKRGDGWHQGRRGMARLARLCLLLQRVHLLPQPDQ
jgi:hypothetical protein